MSSELTLQMPKWWVWGYYVKHFMLNICGVCAFKLLWHTPRRTSPVCRMKIRNVIPVLRAWLFLPFSFMHLADNSNMEGISGAFEKHWSNKHLVEALRLNRIPGWDRKSCWKSGKLFLSIGFLSSISFLMIYTCSKIVPNELVFFAQV